MFKFFKISRLLLIAFVLLQGSPQENNSLLLKGSLNCRTGAVKISHVQPGIGSQDEDVPSVAAALERLRSAGYSEVGVKRLGEILSGACQQEFGLHVGSQTDMSALRPGPTIRQAGPDHGEQGAGSLVWLQKRDEIITFVAVRDTSGVVQYDASGRPTNAEPAQRLAAFVMTKGETDCKPISSVCVKCSDGRIICSTPKLKN